MLTINIKLPRKTLPWIFVFFSFCLPTTAISQDVFLEGNVAYKIDFDALTLNITRLTNQGTSAFSPQLELSATLDDDPFIVLNSFSLDPIPTFNHPLPVVTALVW